MATAPASILEFPSSDESEPTGSVFDMPSGQPFYCSSEYHLVKLSPIAPAVYSFSLHLASNKTIPEDKRTFCASAVSVAKYFGKSEDTIGRAFKDLQKSGFFEVVTPSRVFTPAVCRVLTHKQWAKKYPNQCVSKFEYVWSGEGDPLGQYISVRTGFTVKLKEFQIKAIRKLGLDDSEIIERFDQYMYGAGKNQKPNNVIGGFYLWLKGMKDA